MKTILNSDIHPLDERGNTHSFALNIILKDGIIQTEFGNREVYSLKDNKLVGGVYIDGIGYVLFTKRKDGLSEIGILDEDYNYTSEVVADLGFDPMHPIEVVYRKKDGCGTIVYWTDGNNKPMMYVIGRPDDFKDSNGNFSPVLFNLQMSFNVFPEFNVEVVDSLGELKPGTYQVGIRYVDGDGNAGDIVEITGPYVVYADSLDSNWQSINGGIATVNGYEFENTNKALKVTVSRLDSSYDRYQLVFIERVSGTGGISRVTVSNELNSYQREFIYTGSNFLKEINKNEVIPSTVIKSASAITIDDENIVLGDITYDTEKSCAAQRYASKIVSDLYIRKIAVLDMDDEYNPKHPNALINAGYMPGEVYSFGIVYKFADGTYSKVYHIPGKPAEIHDSSGNNIANSVVYSEGDDLYPMSAVGNTNKSLKYTSKCDYFGTDFHGNKLEGTNVRFHRFPFRDEIGVPLFRVSEGYDSSDIFKRLEVELFSLNANIPDNTVAVITFSAAGATFTYRYSVEYTNLLGNKLVDQLITTPYINTDNIDNISIVFEDGITGNIMTSPNINVTHNVNTKVSGEKHKIYEVYSYNIKFSNIILPNKDVIGKEVVGYKIVRQVVKDSDKSVIDSGITYNLMKEKDMIAAGPLRPDTEYYDWDINEGTNASVRDDNSIVKNRKKIVDKIYGLLSPSVYADKSYSSADKFRIAYEIREDRKTIGVTKLNDVIDGSTYNPDVDKNSDEDKDGMSLKILRVTHDLTYSVLTKTINIEKSNVLSPLEDLKKGKDHIYNINAVNRTGIIETDEPIEYKNTYGYLFRDNVSMYNDYETAPYIPVGDGVFDDEGKSEIIVAGGDTFIFPYTAYTLMYHNTVPVYRRKKSWFSRVVFGVIMMLGGVALSFEGGSGSSLSMYGYSLLRAGLKIKRLKEAWIDAYKKGLRKAMKCKTINDIFYYVKWANFSPHGYSVVGSEDDEIRWFMTVLNPVWFESRINLALKCPLDKEEPYFMESPISDKNDSHEDVVFKDKFYVTADNDKDTGSYSDNYAVSKLTEIRDDKLSYRLPVPDYTYDNPDYTYNDTNNLFVPPVIHSRCCYTCHEEYPGRFVWSDPTSVDNKVDGFRVIRTNNYRDLEKYSGRITYMFSKQGKLYLHTTSGLYVSSKKIKEKVVDDVVVVVGSGEKYSIPPVKLSIDNDFDLGLPYKGASVLTDAGYFWHNPKANKFYKLGNGIEILSNDIENIVGKFFDAPVGNLDSSLVMFGTGYTTVYDKHVNRILFTKKDNTLTADDNDLYCSDGENIYVIRNYKNVIVENEGEGYTYAGVKNCRMVFYKFSDKLSYIPVRRYNAGILPNYHLVIVYNNDSIGDINIQDIVNNPLFNTSFFGDRFKSIRLISIDSSNIFEHFNYIANNFSSDYSGENVIIYDFTSTLSDLTSPCSIAGGNDIRDGNGNYKQSFIDEYDKFYGTNIGGNNSSGIRNKDVFGTVITINSPLVSRCDSQVHNDMIEYQRETLKLAMGNNSYDQFRILSLLGGSNINPEYNVFGFNNDLSYLLSTTPDQGTPFTQEAADYDLYFVFNNDTNIVSVILGIIISNGYPELYTFDNYSSSIITGTNLGINIRYIYFDSVNDLRGAMDLSATISFNIFDKAFISLHSYLPKYYISGRHEFLSYYGNSLYEHNEKNKHDTEYYGIQYGMIYEKHLHTNDKINNTAHTIVWDTYVENTNRGIENFITFDKIIVYNDIQTTGIKELRVNDGNTMSVRSYSRNAVRRRGKLWHFNFLRDILINKNEPFWIEDVNLLQPYWFIDKVHKEIIGKSWNKSARMKGRYLTVRLFFTNFEGMKLKLSDLSFFGQKHKVQ